MVELFEQDERQNNRQSSKGNQLKWENNGIWYKADYTGYEGELRAGGDLEQLFMDVIRRNGKEGY